ncbi:hypothetical protein FEE96_11920 [Parasedimentitalea maritima]|uniref:Uncharacterized protein n=1 Tax=Parasedimentitalea maritima TaxID=2578117 RepID=A0ABY2UXA4_9RHOB|nr:hypothetical protein [Zongyanglinia marina]TLP64472.1 hypothetical protein FEE96_11920 [Zongyanglinia marina]
MQHARAVIALTLALLAQPAASDVTGPGGKTIDCFCTDRSGSRIELGQTICLQVDGRMFMAQCQMSLNVPMWREVQQGCLSSSLDQQDKPISSQVSSLIPL